MRPAIEVTEGHCFKWQNDLYVVSGHTDDNVLVRRIATYWPPESNSPQNAGWHFVESRQEENFNPCCEVDTEFSIERKTKPPTPFRER